MPTNESSENARKQLVAKSNEMIQKSRYSLTSVENKAVAYILSKVQPNDAPEKKYRFYFSEFFRVINWTKASYTDLKMLLQRIADASMWIMMDNGKDTLVRWFDIVDADQNGVGYFEITFHKRMQPYIFNLQQQKEENGIYYTTYSLQTITLMKHQYSPRIFEILKSYQYNNKRWVFELGTGSEYDLQRRIAPVNPKNGKPQVPKSWSNYAIFKRDVIQPAVNDINMFSDIIVDYKPSKISFSGEKFRKYVTIEFVMVQKTQREQSATEEFIDAEYEEVEKSYHQYSLEETFFSDYEKKLAKEKEEVNAEIREKRVENSTHKVFTDCYCDEFTDEALKALYSAANKKIPIGEVRLTDKELWVIDYVDYYKEHIDATGIDTKTTYYKRLLDCLKKDYDNIAYHLTARYRKVKTVDVVQEELSFEPAGEEDDEEYMKSEQTANKMQQYIKAIRVAKE